ncbi:MAG TPA: alpha/beta family hydrolase [Gemmatimonadaceae bacterium]|nr:alpha/beta family hydrolase [Gemmatimonadaceae bacterium]
MTLSRVVVGDSSTSVAFDPAANDSRVVFVCGHGAGGNMSDRGVLAVTQELVRRGLGVVRFNFLYKELRSGRPDPMPLLKETYAGVVAHVRETLHPDVLIIGGRSMGGRVASMLAADGFACDGLLLLAYPLHPDKRPAQLRDAHLPAIRVPVLCFNGTRDTMCTPALMERAIERVPAWQMHWIQGADHGFHVLKSSGRTDAGVIAEVGDVSATWLNARILQPDRTP